MKDLNEQNRGTGESEQRIFLLVSVSLALCSVGSFSLEVIQPPRILADDLLPGWGRKRGAGFLYLPDDTGKGAVEVRVVRPPDHAVFQSHRSHDTNRVFIGVH